MVTTFEDKLSLAFWWLVGVGITLYLFLGVVRTFMIVYN
jgi:hypothetical protein